MQTECNHLRHFKTIRDPSTSIETIVFCIVSWTFFHGLPAFLCVCLLSWLFLSIEDFLSSISIAHKILISETWGWHRYLHQDRAFQMTVTHKQFCQPHPLYIEHLNTLKQYEGRYLSRLFSQHGLGICSLALCSHDRGWEEPEIIYM